MEVKNKTSLDTFMDATSLVPAVVLSGVVDELVEFQVATGVPQTLTNEIYEYLNSDNFITTVETRSAGAFARNSEFRRLMLMKDPRPAYKSFIRHWVAGAVYTDFAVKKGMHMLYPPSFANGAAADIATVYSGQLRPV